MFLFPEESEELPQSFWDCEQHLADLHGPLGRHASAV